MTQNDNQPMTLAEAQEYAVNQITEVCTRMGREGIPSALIIFAIDINHAMATRATLDKSFAALSAENSESKKGG